MELQRAKRQKEQEEVERLQAEQREAERTQAELREAERQQASQPPQINAADISSLMVNRMSELAEAPQLDNELTDSLRKSLQSFFDNTTGIDREYLTKAATDFVVRMRDIEAQRIQRSEPDKRAAMSLIRRVGKIMSYLPDAIKQTLQVVTFNPEAPPMRDLPEDEAEFEEDEEQEEAEESQGLPSSGTPPGPPPPRNPRESSSTPRTGRVQEAVQRIEGPQISSIPATKWQGWKTKTGPTIADMEQSRMSPVGDPESEMADPELREAMMRSLHETRHDPNEPPLSGGASGSGGNIQQGASPLQAGTPNTQSDGEGSVIPNRPPRIATGVAAPQPAQLHSRPITPADVCLILEDRIKREKLRIAELVDKVTAVDQEFTEELNNLKQSKAKEQRQTEMAAIPRPPVRLSSIDPNTPGDVTPRVTRQSRSRPRSQRGVRGRSKADKRRRHPDSGDRRSTTRHKADPIMVTPPVTIPKPTVASIFLSGAEDLSSSCPTSQEPAQTVPQIFQSAGAALTTSGSAQATPQRGMAAGQSDPLGSTITK